MKKTILPFILLIFTLFFAAQVLAANLEVSKSSTFSSNDLNFSAGETVYVRISTQREGSSHVLNIKDNNYSTIKSVNLFWNGGSYAASFTAPSQQGYFSLEAEIEGDGTSVTSVKTIKVGNPASANIKVNVNSRVAGEKSQSQSQSEESKSKVTEPVEIEKADEPDEFGNSDELVVSDEADVYKAHEQKGESWVWATIKEIFSFLWPF